MPKSVKKPTIPVDPEGNPREDKALSGARALAAAKACRRGGQPPPGDVAAGEIQAADDAPQRPPEASRLTLSAIMWP
jgi:hypothetical protein